MKPLPSTLLCFELLITLVSVGCASATTPLRIQSGRQPPVSRLAELRLDRGSDVLVQQTNGETVRGRIDRLGDSELELIDRASARRVIPEVEIETIAKVVKLSKGARTCIGAAVGAAASLPFAISMFGDMMIPGALVGAAVGRATGDSRGEIVFQRRSSAG